MLNPPATPEGATPEEERLTALRRYQILDTPAAHSFDRLTELAAQIFRVPYVALSFVDRDRLWFKSCFGLSMSSLPRTGSLCDFVVQSGTVCVVEDATKDLRFRDDLLVAHPPDLRFFAGAPLRTPEGFVIGVLCLADTTPRSFSPDPDGLLAHVAEVVMREVEMHQALMDLRTTRDELEAHIVQRTTALEHANQELRAQVAERKEAQRRLEESQQRYRSLFEQNKDAVYSFNPEGRFLSANAACEKLCGYSPQQLLQMSFGELIVPKDLKRALAMFDKALRGEAQHGEMAIVHKDGHQIEISVSKMPIIVGGEFVGVYGIAQDITSRAEMERERERLLAEAIDRAERDPLTGLLNHRVFHKRFREELAQAQQSGQSLTVALLDLNDFHFFNDAYGHIAGDDVLRRVASALQETSEQDADVVLARYGGDEFALLRPAAGPRGDALAQSLAARLDGLAYSPPGHPDVIPLTLSIGTASFPDDGTSRLDILNVAEARLRRAKSGGDGQAEHLRAALARSVDGFTMLDALVTAVDSKDRYTRRHSEDVLVYSRQIAEALGLDEKTQRTVATAALLHDIGKIGVPDVILRKPGHLTDEEFQAIRQHPQMGAVIVQAVPGFEETLDAVRHHHERWDGGGYPFGLRGEETPLIARLMAVADAFSAMTTDRPYRKGMSKAQARAVLSQGMGTQWDAVCVTAFLHARQD